MNTRYKQWLPIKGHISRMVVKCISELKKNNEEGQLLRNEYCCTSVQQLLIENELRDKASLPDNETALGS